VCHTAQARPSWSGTLMAHANHCQGPGTKAMRDQPRCGHRAPAPLTRRLRRRLRVGPGGLQHHGRRRHRAVRRRQLHGERGEAASERHPTSSRSHAVEPPATRHPVRPEPKAAAGASRHGRPAQGVRGGRVGATTLERDPQVTTHPCCTRRPEALRLPPPPACVGETALPRLRRSPDPAHSAGA
jgi:hypothetical protein